MHPRSISFALLALLLAACDGDAGRSLPEVQAPYVKTVALKPAAASSLGLTGSVRARVETPLAFQINGRVLRRLVDSGQRVSAGQLLFELDPRDLSLAMAAAKAQLDASESLLGVALADLERHRQLVTRQFISAQALQQSENAYRQAQGQRQAAQAHYQQALNAKAYAQLRAPADGVLIEVFAQPGQVLAAGQAVALLAEGSEREVEVHFAQDIEPPRQGEVLLEQQVIPIRLRETSGAVDNQSRTLRARYVLAKGGEALLLGQLLQTRFARAPQADLYSLPLAALSERGEGPRVWVLRQGMLHSVAVKVHHLDREQVLVSGALNPAEPVVALGTHLLLEGMAARELAK